MVLIMLRLSLDSRQQLFQPWLYSSQPCESYFRAARSFTPVGCTQLSFTMLDFYSRCKKVDCHLRLNSLGHEEGIVYPRHEKNLEKFGGSEKDYKCSTLPSAKEIEEIILRAKRDVKRKMAELGVIVDGNDCFKFDSRLATSLNDLLSKPRSDVDDDILFDECEETPLCGESEDHSDVIDDYDLSVLSSLNNGNFTDCTLQLEKQILKQTGECEPRIHPDHQIESSPFLLVTSDDGNQKVVRKSAFVWFLENGVQRHSNDRLVRVMQTANFYMRQKLIVTKVEKRIVRPGDWCAFISEEKRNIQGSSFLIGHVLCFDKLRNGNRKEKKEKSIHVWQEGDENIGALCDWYKLEDSGILTPQHLFSQGYYSCNNYVCSIPPPKCITVDSSNVVSLSKETIQELFKYIEDFHS